jgi:cellulose biosynthesis protein BcsQ
VTVLASYSIKGGVGKTATAVNLGWIAAEQGLRTLIWDLDPQGAASWYFRIKPKVKGGGKALLSGKRDAEGQIKGTDFDRLDLLPADFSYRHLDLMLDRAKGSRRQVQRLLEPLADDYDLILLDCPPGISLVSENVFRAASGLLVPTIPTPLSVRTLDQLRVFLDQLEAGQAPRLLPFFNLVERGKRLHRETMETLPERYPDLLSARIPHASEVERMGLKRMPLPAFAPRHGASVAYRDLWAELRGQIQLATT